MTDFFSELEEHLDRAAQRQARWGRLANPPRPSGTLVAAVATAAVVIAALVFAVPRLVTDDAEVPAQQPDAGWTAYAPDCTKETHSRAMPVEGGAFPEQVRSRFSVFSGDAEVVRPPIEGFAGLPVWGVQTEEGRLVAEKRGAEAYIVAVADINPSQGCEAPQERPASEREPGVCILLQGEKSHASACWTLRQVDAGESVIGPKPFDLLAAAIPDGHPEIRIGNHKPELVDNVAVGPANERDYSQPLRWEDDPPQDAGAAHDYGCDGPVHPQTLETYSVLREKAPDAGRRFEAPDGVTFLSAPVLAREAYGHKFWLIPAALTGSKPACEEPHICVVTDFGSEAVACDVVPPPDRTTTLTSRIEPGGDPTLLLFAAAADHTPDISLPPEGFDPVTLDVESNVGIAAIGPPEERAREFAEAMAGVRAFATDGR